MSVFEQRSPSQISEETFILNTIFAENVIQLKETTTALLERGAFICVGSCIESHTDNINYYIAIVSSNTLYYILKIIIYI